ncbi:hypothetical protein L6164_013035 [Bauhinia variegata]|uniref:Uncharacterized protein n=1 Tax=Bauhinia variegata TaxID=167791 RepID=A0ACB9PC80_BAUVA|nr:hypothetical protein L6164_013035 [Bauhinia variegata]
MKMVQWSELPSNPLELILLKLCFADIIRLSLVCTSWFKKVDAYMSSSTNANLPHLAVLMFQEKPEGDESDKCYRFSCLGDKKVYKLSNMPEELLDGLCIGSSRGWLVFLDKYMTLSLYNPFSSARIQISSLEAFPYIQRTQHIDSAFFDIHHYDHDMGGLVVRTDAKGLSSGLLKCVLSSDPLHSNGKFGLVVVYGIGCMYMCSELAFYDSEDCQWTKFGTEFGRYDDIFYYKGSFYALCEEERLEIWDYDGSFPLKVKEYETSLEKRLRDTKQSLPFFCRTQSYVLESTGDIMLVVRFISHLYKDGTYISREEYSELLSMSGFDHNSIQRRTFLFHVYKFDFNREVLVQVESLHGRALFLGGNHSQSFSTHDIFECEKNSIYFMRDMDSHACDFGIYRLEDKTIRPYNCGELQSTGSCHFWVFPSLHKSNIQ